MKIHITQQSTPTGMDDGICMQMLNAWVLHCHDEAAQLEGTDQDFRQARHHLCCGFLNVVYYKWVKCCAHLIWLPVSSVSASCALQQADSSSSSPTGVLR